MMEENISLLNNNAESTNVPLFSLPKFDGPLDLLLSLISKNKMDIYDIPVALILEQYISYLEQFENTYAATEISSEFIVMAAELLYIKSKMLLPKEEKEEDPRKALVEALIEYSKIKEIAEYLAARGEDYYYRFPSRSMPPILVKLTKQYDISVLAECMAYLRIHRKEELQKERRDTISNLFQRKVVSVESKIIFILRKLVKNLTFSSHVSFSSLFTDKKDRSDVVATFLATLELIKSGRIIMDKSTDDYTIKLNRAAAQNQEGQENE